MSKPLETLVVEPSPADDLHVEPATNTERQFAEVLKKLVGVERVSVTSHFFDDLGADSMLMAHFCARVRKLPGVPTVSIKDIYFHTTIRDLAAALENGAAIPVHANGTSTTAEGVAPVAAPALSVAAPAVEALAPAGRVQIAACGAFQILAALSYLTLVALAFAPGFAWISRGSGFMDVFPRAALAASLGLLGLSVFPILAKWLLIGRWKPERIRIWSLRYVRFWVVKSLVRANPMVLFAGTPLYILYLQALGAKIGRGAVIFSHHMPVCTDLISIGEHAIVRKDSQFSGYHARGSVIETGSVCVERDAVVGEMTVLDIHTTLGEGAQLGHASSLHPGQSVPPGEHRVGSPANQITAVDYRAVDPAASGAIRSIIFSAMDLISTILLTAVSYTCVVLAINAVAPLSTVFTGATYLRDGLILSLSLYFGAALAGLVVIFTVPRLLNQFLVPDKVYPLYGFHYWIHRFIGSATNIKFYLQILGDSSFIVPYLRGVGYDLSKVVQTGSNFGTDVKHDNPFLVSVGSGTMVADGLSMINADYSSTSFRLSRVTIGADNFIGNLVAYPAQGKTGANCLLATKVLVPLDGDRREGTGLLGSPSFEIPRSVLRDSQLEHPKDDDALRRRLAAKDRHNLVTIGLLLLAQWIHVFMLVLLGLAAMYQNRMPDALAYALVAVVSPLIGAAYLALVERASTGFRDLVPRSCSIYSPEFWSHERYWKLMMMGAPLMLFDGTPLKPLVWRLLGVRIGARVFDDGCHILERTMVTIGDGTTLNMGSIIQPHSQEDGGFKSDRISIGAGCTIGVGALVHYGVTMGDGASLAPGAFLMKGEEVPPHTHWGENPARELPLNGVPRSVQARRAPGRGAAA